MPLEEMFLDSVNPGGLRFLTGCRALTHHYTPYAGVKWPSMAARVPDKG